MQCSVTLDGLDLQYFPCDTLVMDSNETASPIWAVDFSEAPPKATFTYYKDSQELSIEVASIFDEARLRQYRERYYISGEGTLLSISLNSEAVIAHTRYNAKTENLYTFRCVDEVGADVNCDIT